MIENMQSSRKPRLLKQESEPVAILTPLGTTLKRLTPEQDIWADYDPEQVQQALAHSTGALAGVDTKRLLTDLHEARSQE